MLSFRVWLRSPWFSLGMHLQFLIIVIVLAIKEIHILF